MHYSAGKSVLLRDKGSQKVEKPVKLKNFGNPYYLPESKNVHHFSVLLQADKLSNIKSEHMSYLSSCSLLLRKHPDAVLSLTHFTELDLSSLTQNW